MRITQINREKWDANIRLREYFESRMGEDADQLDLLNEMLAAGDIRHGHFLPPLTEISVIS